MRRGDFIRLGLGIAFLLQSLIVVVPDIIP
jgi:hypothetical protein